jgi:putative inorganic carbon (hco3(-)) transporter
MDFALFVLATAVLFLRPQDFVPEAATLPVYLCVLLIACVVSVGAILRQANPTTMQRRPITVCVAGLLVAAALSHLSHGLFWGLRKAGIDFIMILAYYLLAVAVINTPQRLQRLLTCLAVFAVIISTLAILQYHGAITLPEKTVVQQSEMDEDGEENIRISRLCGTGLFNDPNDLCLLLIIGLGVGAFHLTNPNGGAGRLLWLAPLMLFLYALAMTQSRGGLLAFLLAVFVLFHARFGTWKAVALAGVALPVLMLCFAGRQTSFTAGTEAGQDRIELWREALMLFKESPLFGIGYGLFEDHAHLVAHNSYVHCFAELGFLGGTLFLGAFLVALWTLYRLGRPGAIADPSLARLRPYLFAILAGYATGMMFLSRAYIPPTYLMLAITTAFVSLAGNAPPLRLPQMNHWLIGRLAMASMAFLFAMHLFVKISMNRG